MPWVDMRDDENHDTEIPDERRASVCAAFGALVEQLRTDRELSRGQLAERSGLDTDTISRLENGRFSPSLHTVRKLALGLGMRLSEIFEAFERETPA
jgi:transcriptional regulator with XRE-family HTH domain